jgi:dTDP-4-amino-4,6-dideoxygalactose transaminase
MSPPADPIPLIDLQGQHRRIREEVLAAASRVASSQRFINGPEVGSFEAAMAERLGVKHAIGVSSGTDALLMVLMAMEIGAGDEVITTPFSFISTAEVILRVGARPRFVDVLPDTLLMRAAAVRGRLSSRTRAIIPVHLYGQLCDMDELMTLSREHGIPVIEDCAQSMGAGSNGTTAGSFGQAGAFSFFPSKNLGGWGDGGMLVTNDRGIADRCRQIREHGANGRDRFEVVGGNFRLDTLQAAVLEVKLRYLDQWIESRRSAARTYNRLFSEVGLAPAVSSAGTKPDLAPAVSSAGTKPDLAAGPDQTRHPGHRILLPRVDGDRRHAFNLFVVQAERRDELKAHLDLEGIGTAVYYPSPLHLQPCLKDLGCRPGDFPVAEEAAQSVLALPLFPEITAKQQKRVVDTIAGFYRQNP